MVTCSSDPNWVNDYQNLGTTHAYVTTYDGAGRQTGSGPGSSPTDCATANATQSSTYDAENRIHSSNVSNAGGTVNNWGPDLRQRSVTINSNSATAHWDGNTLLFATGGSKTPLLYIGKLGAMDVNGNFFIEDRDQSGDEASSHGLTTTPPSWMKQNNQGNANWYDGWSLGTLRTVTVYKSGQQIPIEFLAGSCNVFDKFNTFDACPYLPNFAMKRADGYKMVGGIVQGARTYDPTSGQWLTPDPYAGDVSSPMSQKPFVWNGNNPVQFADPSGYTINWDSIPTDVIDEIADMMYVSPTFADEINEMDNDPNNNYSFCRACDQSVTGVLGTGQSQILSDDTIVLNSVDTGPMLDADIAHEVGHASDISSNLFSAFNIDIPGTQIANSEANTYEEAHGYMMEYQVLKQTFNEATANQLMGSQMPYWSGLDQAAWSMQSIERVFCTQFGGASGC
jgi:RHS repeat-associated protein